MPIAELDKEQRKAATAGGEEVAVSAGAGSGKTRLLAARYLHLVGRERIPTDAIAAITFTNKAADQMKARIAAEARVLAQAGGEEGTFWRGIAINAHRARISTIHSFCGSILRRYPVEAGIDPSFEVIDQVANAELRNETIRDVIDNLLNEDTGDIAFLAGAFGMDNLKTILNGLLCIRPKVLAFLDTLGHGGELTEESFAAFYERRLTGRLDRFIAALGEFHALRPPGDGLVPVYDTVLGALKRARAAIGNGTTDCDALATARKSIKLKSGSKAKWGEETLARLKETLRESREFLGELESYFRRERETAPRAASLLMKLFTVLDERYLDRKKEQGMLDHDDLLIETWRLLRIRFDVCRRVAGAFSHILVDEFQDTDRLQMDILTMITGNSSSRLFAVGDPKQSVYRFRGADVTVFSRFILSNNTEFYPLNANYRSSPAVMAFVNRLFGRLMGDEPATEYDVVYRPMKPDRKESPVSPAVEVAVFDHPSAEKRRRAEAAYITRRIGELAGKNGDGVYSLKDMAILLRTGTSLTLYEEALLGAGIPFVNRIGGKLATSPVAYDIGNLLGWFDEPENPALLVSVLASPFFSIGADSLYALRTGAGSTDAMPAYFMKLAERTGHGDDDGSELIQAARIYSRLRDATDRLTVSDLLERVFDETGYTLVMAADRIEGMRSLAMIDLIVETAARFEREGGRRRDFAALLRSGMPFTDETAQVETAGNAVSILTIHGAKGLEFKVVFLADVTGAGKTGGGTLLFDEDLGPGFSILGDRGGSDETSVRKHIRGIERQKEGAESKRLFYVASTRAGDILAISGGPPAKRASDTANWMSWLHEALDLPPDGSADGTVTDLLRYRWIDLTASGSTTAVDSAGGAGRPEQTVEGEEGFDDTLADTLDMLTAAIPEIAVPTLPTVVSVSALLDYRDDPERYLLAQVFGIEREMAGESGGYGASYGEFVHRVFERIDFSAPETWKGVVRTMAARAAGLPSEQVETVISGLARFASSDLGRRLSAATTVRREEPFALTIDDILVCGTIDLMFMEEDGTPVIVDYKTGPVPADDDPIMHRYEFQLAVYALAVWRATDRVPSSLVLAFISAGEVHRITCTEKLLEETEAALRELFARMAHDPLLATGMTPG